MACANVLASESHQSFYLSLTRRSSPRKRRSTSHPIGVWGLPSFVLPLRSGELVMPCGHRRPPFGNQAQLSRNYAAVGERARPGRRDWRPRQSPSRLTERTQCSVTRRAAQPPGEGAGWPRPGRACSPFPTAWLRLGADHRRTWSDFVRYDLPARYKSGAFAQTARPTNARACASRAAAGGGWPLHRR